MTGSGQRPAMWPARGLCRGRVRHCLPSLQIAIHPRALSRLARGLRASWRLADCSIQHSAPGSAGATAAGGWRAAGGYGAWWASWWHHRPHGPRRSCSSPARLVLASPSSRLFSAPLGRIGTLPHAPRPTLPRTRPSGCRHPRATRRGERRAPERRPVQRIERPSGSRDDDGPGAAACALLIY
jgi:hypothetical protein